MAKVRVYSKKTCTELCFEKHPEWRNDPVVHEELKKGSNDILNHIPDEVFGRVWALERIITDDNDIGEIGDYIITGGWVISPSFAQKIETDETMFKFDFDGDNFVMQKGEVSITLSAAEFWAVIRFGCFYDTKSEVRDYLEGLDEPVNGVTSEQFLEVLDEITEKVIEDRLSEENGEQIYYVLETASRGKCIMPKGTFPRCRKCVNELHCPKNKDDEGTCPDYHRDSPDGGFYG